MTPPRTGSGCRPVARLPAGDRSRACAASARTRRGAPARARTAARRAPRPGRRRTGTPRAARDRPRFELRQVDVAQREHAQRLEQRARLVGQREHDRRLVGARVRQRLPADDEEARDVVVEVLDRRRPATIRPKTSPARAEAIAAASVEPARRHHLGAAGGVVGRDDLDAGQRPQKPLALRQRLRVRVDAPQPVQRRAGQRQQVVDDRQLDLADDRQSCASSRS